MDPRRNAVGCTFMATRPSVIVNPLVRLAKAGSLRQRPAWENDTIACAAVIGPDPSDLGIGGQLAIGSPRGVISGGPN
jgi:hypothetical protein